MYAFKFIPQSNSTQKGGGRGRMGSSSIDVSGTRAVSFYRFKLQTADDGHVTE